MEGTRQGQWGHNIICAVGSEDHRVYEGLSIPQAADTAGKQVVHFVWDPIAEERLAVTVVQYHAHRTEADLRDMTGHLAHMVCTDASLLGSHPHPRGYGTYRRHLGYYARE